MSPSERSDWIRTGVRCCSFAYDRGLISERDAREYLVTLADESEWAKSFLDGIHYLDCMRSDVYNDICHDLAPILARGGTRAEIAKATRQADPEHRFTSDERRAIAEQEAAWWVRLHATLPKEVADAA